MICPNCGETIEDKALYCEKCGEEIKIVPSFELDFDFAADILAREVLQSKEREAKEAMAKQQKQKRIRIACVAGVAALLVFLLAIGVWYHFYTKSYDYQIKVANAAIQKEDYASAVTYLEKAYALNETDMELLLDLAEGYLRAQQMNKYISALLDVINSPKASTSQQSKAYTKLIAHYEVEGEYTQIEALLAECSLDDILLEYRRFIPLPPEFSFPEGQYESMVPLKLSSNTAGNIYFTMDGSVPEEKEALLYTAPLYLEAGEHVISAIFVNEYGLKSEVVTKTYNIELAVPSAPEVFQESGEYDAPTLIEIQEFDDITVYYTVDGTYPSNHSTLYKGPIPMPLGKSTFRFVGYNEDGVPGEITERTYNLVLDTDLTTDTACYDIIKKMMQIGKISDTIGTAAGLDGWYKYQFQYPISIEGYGDFYVIAELFQDTSGNREKTGTYYGVNIKDRTIYKLSKNETGNYLLEGF